jgi:hypothetical protein
MANKVLRRLVILFGAGLLASLAGPAFAQANGDNKPPEQQNPEANKSEAAHIAEVSRTLTGAAGLPECIHLGELAVTLMAKNDLDTAQRHINLYDRFGCPGQHLRLSFRCILSIGMPGKEAKGGETVETLVRGCWANPSMVANPQTLPAAATAAPAATPAAPHPPAPAAPATAGTGAH